MCHVHANAGKIIFVLILPCELEEKPRIKTQIKLEGNIPKNIAHSRASRLSKRSLTPSSRLFYNMFYLFLIMHFVTVSN